MRFEFDKNTRSFLFIQPSLVLTLADRGKARTELLDIFCWFMVTCMSWN